MLLFFQDHYRWWVEFSLSYGLFLLVFSFRDLDSWLEAAAVKQACQRRHLKFSTSLFSSLVGRNLDLLMPCCPLCVKTARCTGHVLTNRALALCPHSIPSPHPLQSLDQMQAAFGSHALSPSTRPWFPPSPFSLYKEVLSPPPFQTGPSGHFYLLFEMLSPPCFFTESLSSCEIYIFFLLSWRNFQHDWMRGEAGGKEDGLCTSSYSTGLTGASRAGRASRRRSCGPLPQSSPSRPLPRYASRFCQLWQWISPPGTHSFFLPEVWKKFLVVRVLLK